MKGRRHDSSDRHSRKRHKRHKQDSGISEEEGYSARHSRKLLQYAAQGRVSKVKKLIRKGPATQLAAARDARGNTALHEACFFGHLDVARYLLSHGSDINAQNLGDDTAAHVAAQRSHLHLLIELLQASPPPNVALTNAQGVSVQDLVDSALNSSASAAAAAAEAPFAGAAGSQPPGRVSPASSSEDEESAWAAKMAAFADDAEDDAAVWEHFGDGSFHAAGPGPETAAVGESEDEWASRIWAEMQRKQRRHEQEASAAFARASAAEHQRQKSEARERAARVASERILQEERAKDAGWRRRALAAGPVLPISERRLRYDTGWQRLQASSTHQLFYVDIPWVVADASQREDFESIILHDVQGAAGVKKRLRLEIMRWHPDKFIAAFGSKLAASEKDRIVNRVKEMSQMLTSIMSASKA